MFSVHKRSIIDLIVKFDTYRNLQRHRAVLRAIARFSGFIRYSVSCFGKIREREPFLFGIAERHATETTEKF